MQNLLRKKIVFHIYALDGSFVKTVPEEFLSDCILETQIRCSYLILKKKKIYGCLESLSRVK